MDREKNLLEQARLLVSRLERISVDSIWSRRSSGHRGALLRWIARLEAEETPHQPPLTSHDLDHLQSLIEAGFQFLEKAAKEY
jgi:hypothetical protein